MQPDGNTAHIQKCLDRAVGGEQGAYEELLARAARRLRKLTVAMFNAYPHLKRWEQADDVFQNAVLRLYRSLAEVQPRTVRDFFALAATQIRRTLIDLARHHFGPEGEAARHHSDPGTDVLEGHGAADEEPATLEAWARFHHAVDLLPEDEREVVHLIWYGGITRREAAEVLDISERTVLRRLQRARRRLNRPPFAEET